MAATKATMAGAAAAPSGIAATQAAAGLGSAVAPAASTFGTLAGAGAPAGVAATQAAAGLGTLTPVAGMTGAQKLGLGLGATSLMSLMGSQNQPKLAAPGSQGMIRPYTYSSTQNPAGGEYPSPYAGRAQYDMAGNPIMDTRERDYFTQSFTAGEPYKAAAGGLMAAGGPVERMSQMNTALNPQGGMYPQGMIDKTQYALPIQRPTSMEVLDAGAQRMFAKGGIVGYAGGGMMGHFLRSLQESNKNSLDPTMRNFVSFEGDLQNQMSPQSGTVNSLPKFTYDRENQKYIPMADGGITYDASTQRYSGLPAAAPAAPVDQLPADLVASLTPQYQAANPNFYSYDAKNQRYGAGNPSMSQLNAFKAMQDQKAAEEAAAAAQSYQSYQSYAMGGNVQGYNLGGYSDGGRLLRGPGDGVSDDIPAVIGNRQPARLADGEFVIPARIVSELGNGSTDAGAKRLYAMMDKIQAGRKKTVGKGNVAKDTKAKKHLLA
jgi:hypothetical protein